MNKIRLIQCGVGGYGTGWIKNHTSQSPDFDLAAIVDLSPETLATIGDTYGVPAERRFTSLEEALEKVEADAVLTVTPPKVHVAHARLAFARGLHLMTEKPLADTIAQAREMIQLAKGAGRQLVVSQQYRYSPVVSKLRDLVRTGAVGEIGHGHIAYYLPADLTGTFRETMDFPLLLDMSIHHFDLIRYVTGRDIVKITARSLRPAWSWFRHDPGLKALIELEGGVVISYSGDWSALGRPTSWNGDWRLQGGAGSLHLEADQLKIEKSERWCKNRSTEPVEIPPLTLTAGAATLRSFAEAIRTGVPAETSGERNFNSMAAVAAGMQSALEGRTVDVER